MRKSGIIFLILLLIGGGIYLFVSKYEINIGSFRWMFSKEHALLRELTVSFLEDIQFKDFDTAATYHNEEDQKDVDIPKLIERLFKIKPELLDIMKFEITDVHVDSSGKRARVKTHTTVKILNTDELKEPDLVFYWQKENGQWRMKLESSLQNP